MDPARNSTLENGIGRSGNLNLNHFMEKTRNAIKNANHCERSVMAPDLALYNVRPFHILN